MTSEVRQVKIFTEKTTNTTTSNDSGVSRDKTDKTERREFHSFDELPPETKKYIDDLLGPEASTKFDNISVVSERSTRYTQPEVRVVNISHKKVVEENRQIPIMDQRQGPDIFARRPDQSTSTTRTSTTNQQNSTKFEEDTKTFSKEMLNDIPAECKKYVNDFMTQQGMQDKEIEHVTIHRTKENTTATSYANDIPDLQVKNCLQSADKIVVEIDASGFSAQDITMKVSGRNLVIQGRKEGPDPMDPSTTLRKELKRDIVMPPGVDGAHITCDLNSLTGRLTVTIPFPQSAGGEFLIPIRTV